MFKVSEAVESFSGTSWWKVFGALVHSQLAVGDEGGNIWGAIAHEKKIVMGRLSFF